MARGQRPSYDRVRALLDDLGDSIQRSCSGYVRARGAGAAVLNTLGGGAFWDKAAGRAQAADTEVLLAHTHSRLLIFGYQRKSLELRGGYPLDEIVEIDGDVSSKRDSYVGIEFMGDDKGLDLHFRHKKMWEGGRDFIAGVRKAIAGMHTVEVPREGYATARPAPVDTVDELTEWLASKIVDEGSASRRMRAGHAGLKWADKNLVAQRADVALFIISAEIAHRFTSADSGPLLARVGAAERVLPELTFLRYGGPPTNDQLVTYATSIAALRSV